MINIKTYIGLVKLLMSVKAVNESKVKSLTNCTLFIKKYSTKRKCKLTSLNIKSHSMHLLQEKIMYTQVKIVWGRTISQTCFRCKGDCCDDS